MAVELEGVAELVAKLAEMSDPKQGAQALREAARKGMLPVLKAARMNITIVSPGQAAYHWTYKKNLVSQGYAARSVRTDVKMSKDKTVAVARLGVLKEAFYSISFFELGTGFNHRPWLVPAFESQQSAALRGIGDALKARIERIAKKRAAGGK